jgi:hypothetical protein
MWSFVDPDVLEAARAAATELAETAEEAIELRVPQSHGEAIFQVRRDLVPGFLPIGRFDIDGAVFYIGGDTGRTDDG